MSFTLHTTEIWWNTSTDSGGMKDRTHGMFLQKASEMDDTNTAQLCDFGYDSSQQSHSDAPTVVKPQDGGWAWHLVQRRRLGPCDLWRNPRGGGSERGGRWPLPFFLSLSWSLSLSETRPALLQAFSLLLKYLSSGTLSQVWAGRLMQPRRGPPGAQRFRLTPPPQSHAPMGKHNTHSPTTPGAFFPLFYALRDNFLTATLLHPKSSFWPE